MKENKNIGLRDFLKNKLLFCMNLIYSLILWYQVFVLFCFLEETK